MQAWRSLVMPWVARHRRHSSWRLWGPHTLLLYILHICSLSHCECNYMCNQLWSNHTYTINLLFSCIPLFFHYIHYFHYFYHYHHYSHFAARSGTYLVVTLLWCSNVCFHHCFIQYYCIVLFHSFGVHRPFGLWYCIWNAAHKIFGGGMCYPVKFGWYLGHLESPITPVTCLVLMWIFHIFILSNLKLKFFNLIIHL